MKVVLGSHDNWDIVEDGYTEPVDTTAKTSLANAQNTTSKESQKMKRKLYSRYFKVLTNPHSKKSRKQTHQRTCGRLCQNHFMNLKGKKGTTPSTPR